MVPLASEEAMRSSVACRPSIACRRECICHVSYRPNIEVVSYP
jgi:hypothetical protein